MRPFILSTRVAIKDKGSIKNRIQDSADSVVEQPIPNQRLTNQARFRVGDAKLMIATVAIISTR